MPITLFDTCALRGILAEERSTRRQFAAACGLCAALTGVRRHSELARQLIAEIEEARHAAA